MSAMAIWTLDAIKCGGQTLHPGLVLATELRTEHPIGDMMTDESWRTECSDFGTIPLEL